MSSLVYYKILVLNTRPTMYSAIHSEHVGYIAELKPCKTMLPSLAPLYVSVWCTTCDHALSNYIVMCNHVVFANRVPLSPCKSPRIMTDSHNLHICPFNKPFLLYFVIFVVNYSKSCEMLIN